jgi:hypothetical protein
MKATIDKRVLKTIKQPITPHVGLIFIDCFAAVGAISYGAAIGAWDLIRSADQAHQRNH